MGASKKWPGGAVRLALGPTATLPAALLRLTPAAHADGGHIAVHVALPLLPALDLTVEAPAFGRSLGLLLGAPERWTGFEVDRFQGNDLIVRWSILMPTGNARPWQVGAWRPLDGLLGAAEISNVALCSASAELVLDEGAYPMRVELREQRWTRARWPGFWARASYAFVCATERPVPVPGGPINAWTVEANTIAEALDRVGAQVCTLRCRKP